MLRSRYKTGAYKVRFQGNQIAFANALWTGFEILSTVELGNQWHEAVIKSRQGQTFNEVFNALSSALTLQLIEEQLPGMQDIFLKLVTQNNHE
jgi:ABC-2 type transport system ATP-binding protein